MDYRRLEAFCKVYELKSFSKAGEALFLSQPTISAHVSSLERELNIRLLDRLGRMVLPTPAGEILYRRAMESFSTLESAKAELQLLQDRVAGSLVIGGSTIPANYLLPDYVGRFTRNYPDVNVTLKVGDSEQIIRLVSSGELILGIVGVRDEQYDMTFRPILRDELIIVASKELIGGRDVWTLDDLFAQPWVMREQGSGTRKALEIGLLEQGRDIRELKVKITVESTQAVLQCVKAGLGFSITSQLAASPFIERGELAAASCPELSLVRHFYTVYHEKRHFFPAARYFLDFLEQTAN